MLQTTVECLIPRLPQITALLINPPYKPPVHTTCGVLKVPLGRTRLSLAKLVSALLSTNHPPLNSALAQANTATVLLDLFFEYSLNNFLHAQVESCVHSIIFWKEKTDLDVTQENVALPDPNSSSLQTPKMTEPEPADSEGTEHPLQEKIMDNPALVHLLTNGRLLDRLITTWTKPNLTPVVSYMGHVTRISNYLVMACGSDTVPLCQSRTLLLQLLSKLPEETQATWVTVMTGRLADTNKMNIKPETNSGGSEVIDNVTKLGEARMLDNATAELSRALNISDGSETIKDNWGGSRVIDNVKDQKNLGEARMLDNDTVELSRALNISDKIEDNFVKEVKYFHSETYVLDEWVMGHFIQGYLGTEISPLKFIEDKFQVIIQVKWSIFFYNLKNIMSGSRGGKGWKKQIN